MKKDKSTSYTISKTGINRRISAYTTLIISFILGLIVFSFNWIIAYSSIYLYAILILAVLLFLTRVLVIKYFNSIIKNKIILTPEYIKKNENEYLIKDINQIVTKMTSNNYVREIKVILNNKNIFYINGIDNFERFAKELESYLPKNAISKNLKEPIDYDHPLFYFFFGLLMSILSIAFTKLFMGFSNSQLTFVYYLISISTIIMGIYFIISKPIYKRDEKSNQITDYIWGVSFIVAGILIILFYII